MVVPDKRPVSLAVPDCYGSSVFGLCCVLINSVHLGFRLSSQPIPCFGSPLCVVLYPLCCNNIPPKAFLGLVYQFVCPMPPHHRLFDQLAVWTSLLYPANNSVHVGLRTILRKEMVTWKHSVKPVSSHDTTLSVGARMIV